jgi:hypothetical protein
MAYCETHPHYILPCHKCAKETATPIRKERHRWVKPEIHHYVCGKCGLEKINEQRDRNYWVQVYKMPDGSTIEADKVPPCAVGPLTAERLQQYADVIDEQIPKKADDGWQAPF